MTALTAFLLAYVCGLICLDVLDLTGHIDLRLMVHVLCKAFHPTPYTGRHRTDGLSTMQLVDEKRAARVALREDTASLFLPVFVDEAPLCPPTYPEYDHGAGVNRYVYLRPAVLAAQASMAKRTARLAREKVSA